MVSLGFGAKDQGLLGLLEEVGVGVVLLETGNNREPRKLQEKCSRTTVLKDSPRSGSKLLRLDLALCLPLCSNPDSVQGVARLTQAVLE
jgi:hypothetical protein